jgi:hypothetical protein
MMGGGKADGAIELYCPGARGVDDWPIMVGRVAAFGAGDLSGDGATLLRLGEGERLR